MCCCKDKVQDIITTDAIDLSLVAPIVKKFDGKEGTLITILQEVQETYGYLPKSVLSEIARLSGVKEAKVYGVATFYTQFRLNPIGKNLIMLCQGTACYVNGSAAIEKAVCEELGIQEGQTTDDNVFTFNNVACLGCCSLAPVMMINDETYANLTPERTKEILREIKEKESKEA
jgi:NADH-quinone oxidoreductase subunit E